MSKLNKALLADLLAIEEAVLEKLKLQVIAGNIDWRHTQDQRISRIAPLKALIKEQIK